jgi:Tol biopolymer transport system component
LAIVDKQGRLVVTRPNGSSVVPIATASQGQIAHPTWSPDGSRLVWSATSPIGAQVAATNVGPTTTAVTIALTEPAPTNFAWRPPLARTVLGLPTTTTTPATTPRVAWSRSNEAPANNAEGNPEDSEVSDDFGVLDLVAAATLRTLTSGARLDFWLSPDGTRAIVHSGNEDLSVVDLDTGVVTPLQVKAAEFETPVWLENNLVLLAVQASANSYLSVIDVSTGRRQDLLRYEGTIQFVVDSSGQRIAYQVNSGGGGGNNPAMAPLEQAPPTTVPTATIGRLSLFERRNNTTRSILDSAALAFTWSPTSDRLAFLAQASAGALQWRFWTERSIESSVLFQPSPAVQQYIQAFTEYDQTTRWFSPDGRAFVFSGRVADLEGVWVQVLDGFGPPARVSEGTLAVWSPQ